MSTIVGYETYVCNSMVDLLYFFCILLPIILIKEAQFCILLSHFVPVELHYVRQVSNFAQIEPLLYALLETNKLTKMQGSKNSASRLTLLIASPGLI